jgi:hypothetical protein
MVFEMNLFNKEVNELTQDELFRIATMSKKERSELKRASTDVGRYTTQTHWIAEYMTDQTLMVNLAKHFAEKYKQQSQPDGEGDWWGDLYLCKNLIPKITDQNALIELACMATEKTSKDANNYIFRPAVVTISQDVLIDMVKNSKINEFLCCQALWCIEDTEILLEFANTVKSKEVRETAMRSAVCSISKKGDKDRLMDFARNHEWELARDVAVSRFDGDEATLHDFAMNDKSDKIRTTAIVRIKDKERLADIARNADSPEARYQGVRCFIQKHFECYLEDVLPEILQNDSNARVRAETLKGIEDVTLIEKIAREDNDPTVRMAAISSLKKQGVLVDIAQNDRDLRVRKTATKKIKDKNLKKEFEQAIAALEADVEYLEFKNFNFKLAIINELMYVQEILFPKIDAREFIDVDEKGYDESPKMKKMFKALKIEKELATQIKELRIEAPDEIYRQLWWYWDGECDTYTITQITEAELSQFPNLKKIEILHMGDVCDKTKKALEKLGIEYEFVV